MSTYPLTLLYDASCPLCNLEMHNLMARNKEDKLRFIDISVAEFDASPYGISKTAMMTVMHGIKADGSIVTGVEAIRLAYTGAGLGWLAAPTAWPILKSLCNWAYPHIAKHRHLVSEKLSNVIIAIAARRMAARIQSCKDGACDLHQK